ncbi:hypothetical protein B0H19DRAFT_1265097 [Mycena capillaripes]|nr:hypothetical protein B0H19DRAFT_1265097 [Mycena capillaripes]
MLRSSINAHFKINTYACATLLHGGRHVFRGTCDASTQVIDFAPTESLKIVSGWKLGLQDMNTLPQFLFGMPEAELARRRPPHFCWISLLSVLLQALRVRERVFLRAVMTHVYNLAENKQIYPEQIKVRPTHSVLSQRLGTDNGWWNDVLRTVRSARRTFWHSLGTIGMRHGFSSSPGMHTETSRVHESVADFGRSLGPGATIESVRDDAALKELLQLRRIENNLPL